MAFSSSLFQSLALSASLIIAGLSATLLLWYTMRRRKAVVQLQRAAKRYARGDLSNPPQIDTPGELAELADALTMMARQLDSRLSTVVAQRNEMGAVLSSMAEGVLTINNEENLLSANAAAATMLKLQPAKAIGQPIQTVIRNPGLHTAIRQTFAKQLPVQSEITLHADDPSNVTVGQSDRHIQIQTALLHGEDATQRGVVIVLHDVTQVRRLESMRKDFVANVSHEIKTPIAAIKAAVENLIDDAEEQLDAADTNTNPMTGRFHQIIHRQAGRMNAIIEDLLSLARIEQDQNAIAQDLQPGSIARVLAGAIETCQANAQSKSILIDCQCDPVLTAMMQPTLLEQALVNLIDNAVKYSPENTRVSVTAETKDQEIILSVRDQGRGIEPTHLSRIFERFYRTDKARSREMGGTGLGLSIVKHVAEAHGGRVSVDSTPASGAGLPLSDQPGPADELSAINRPVSGSVFRIHLPATTPQIQTGGARDTEAR